MEASQWADHLYVSCGGRRGESGGVFEPLMSSRDPLAVQEGPQLRPQVDNLHREEDN